MARAGILSSGLDLAEPNQVLSLGLDLAEPNQVPIIVFQSTLIFEGHALCMCAVMSLTFAAQAWNSPSFRFMNGIY